MNKLRSICPLRPAALGLPASAPLLGLLTVVLSWPLAASVTLRLEGTQPTLSTLSARAIDPTLPNLGTEPNTQISNGPTLPSSAFTIPAETPLPAAEETPLSLPVQTPIPNAAGPGIRVVNPVVGERGTVLSFSTPGYRVRVIARNGSFFMNVFNRYTKQVELRDVPAVVSRSSARPNDLDSRFYTAQQGDLTYTAYQNVGGGVNNLLIVPPQLD